MRFYRLSLTLVCLLMLVSATVAHAGSITVAAAISMKDALARVADSYKAEGGDDIEFTFGSSGQMAAQITAGAPIDVFISAARKQVDALKSANLLDDASIRLVAGNALVLIVPASSEHAPTSVADLADAQFKRIAVGQPKTVPAGDYSAEVLKYFQLDQKLADRLIFGTNVRQVLTYVERGEVSAGLVYATDAKEAGAKVKVVATAPPQSHAPIVYPAAVVRASKNADAARKFLAYLSGAKAQAILATFGFTSPGPAPTTAPSTDRATQQSSVPQRSSPIPSLIFTR